MNALSEIRSRAESAAAGPWRIERHDLSLWVLSEDQMLEANLGYVGNHPERNAEFIAHSRTDVIRLIDALDAVEDWMKNLDAIEDADPTSATNRNASAAGVASAVRSAIAAALAGKP